MTIGESIRYHRKRLNLTQVQLAERLDVSAQAVSKWENDVGLPDISIAVPLARALGTTTDELLRFGERYQEFETLWEKELEAQDGADDRRLLEISVAAIREFCYDKPFYLRATRTAKKIADETQDPDVRLEYMGRAGAYAQMLVEIDPTDKASRQLRADISRQLKIMWVEQPGE